MRVPTTMLTIVAALTARPVALIATTVSVGAIAIASRLVGIAIASRLVGIAIVAFVRVVSWPGVAIFR